MERRVRGILDTRNGDQWRAVGERKQGAESSGRREKRHLISTAESVDEYFFLFFRELGECIERREVASERGNSQYRENLGRKPGTTGPATGKKDARTDAAKKNLHAKHDENGHPGIPLPLHFAELHSAREIQ